MLIIPTEGRNPTKHTHVVVWLVILVCGFAFAATLYVGEREIFDAFAFIPAAPYDITLLTSMFLHAGVLHIIGNMFFLGMFGDNVEDVLGHFIFLLSYLVCGMAATVGYAWLHAESPVPLVGASGAISGVLGIYLVFFPRVAAKLSFFLFHRQVHSIRTTILVAIGGWFAMQLALGFVVEMTSVGENIRIAFSAHIAGFLAGLLLGKFFVALGYMENYVSQRKRHWLLGYGKSI